MDFLMENIQREVECTLLLTLEDGGWRSIQGMARPVEPVFKITKTNNCQSSGWRRSLCCLHVRRTVMVAGGELIMK